MCYTVPGLCFSVHLASWLSRCRITVRFCLHNYHDGKFHLRNGSVYFTTLLEIVVNGIGGRVAILVGGHPVAYSLARPSVSSLPADHQPELLSKICESRATGELVSFFLCFCWGMSFADQIEIISPHALECSSLCFCCFVSLRWKHNASLCPIVDPKFPFLFFALRQG